MTVRIPTDLIPADGRFGSGPSRIHPEHLAAVASSPIMGTSHRQRPVKEVVASLRQGLRQLFHLPEDWEVVLGNGGATAFWAVAAASLIRHRSAHAIFGEFGAKFAAESASAPHLADPFVLSAPAGSVALLTGEESDEGGAIDVFAHPHHETSTGALSPLRRIGADDQLLLIDATSVAGGIDVDVTLCDAYYFSPQKCFGSDGGLWVALLSPAALERAKELRGAAGRWVPQFLDLSLAIENSVKDQTLNTPALATLIMLDQQIQWMNKVGGLAEMEARSRAASGALYDWAQAHPLAEPFVAQEFRSHVVATIDLDDSISAPQVIEILRSNGIVDVDPYRSLGRNQLRVATFPNTSLEDAQALVGALDWVIQHVASHN
ncbi:MAG: phosphoserine transaminase [Actinomycetaceae bacterium]|nr:phosphoserine transaminase [Actinomycetaceae bacterium]